MKRSRYVLFGALAAVALGVLAQGGGIPSRLRLQSLGVGAAPPSGTGNVTVAGDLTVSSGTVTLPNASIADAALSSNVPLLNVSNTFTAPIEISDATNPYLALTETGGGTTHYLQWASDKIYLSAAAGDSSGLCSNSGNYCFTLNADGTADFPSAGTFLNTVYVQNTAPYFDLTETDATANNQRWLMQASGATYYILSCTDNLAACGYGLKITRSDDTVGAVSTDGTLAWGGGAAISNSSAVAQVSSGTFEMTWGATCTTDPSQTWNYYKVGQLVQLTMVDGVSCTSDQTFFSSDADLPVALRPSTQIPNFGVVGITDNGTFTANDGCINIGTNGVMAVSRSGCSSSTFTASGTKQIDASGVNSFSYYQQ